MATLTKHQTALLLASGDFWHAVAINDETVEALKDELSDLTGQADNDASLMGTGPDGTVFEIGSAPRRPVNN